MDRAPKTAPPFCGRPPPTASPVTPFKYDPNSSKAVPAGNFSIIRSVFNPGDKKIDPVPVVRARIADIIATNASVQDIPIVVSPFSTRNTSTSCYLTLAPSLLSPDPKAEPRTDLLPPDGK
ncbi:hypothetical protein C8R44DRAFT_883673 [Mycena epipterygia]|nr:hypothetical protein C8R44DRAFT_883673 [Mycena epipterygia]